MRLCCYHSGRRRSEGQAHTGRRHMQRMCVRTGGRSGKSIAASARDRQTYTPVCFHSHKKSCLWNKVKYLVDQYALRTTGTANSAHHHAYFSRVDKVDTAAGELVWAYSTLSLKK